MSIDVVSTAKLLKILRYVLLISIMLVYLFSFNSHRISFDRLLVKKNYTLAPNVNRCTVIILYPRGRLGNNLFQFATAYGVSLEYSCSLYIGPNIIRNIRQYFEIDMPNLLTENQLSRTSSAIKIGNRCTYFANLILPNTSQTIRLVRHWQVHRYFANHTDKIRHQLQFKKTILDQAKNFIKTHISGNVSNLVGIHIRRGDFVGKRNVSSDEFIFDAMDYFTRKYHSVNFIIVSSNKAYCRRVYGKRNDIFFTPDSFNAGTDMAVISLCDHAVITVGTYGWWGAFLLHNKTGEVITDSKPNHNPLDINCKGSDYFPYWYSFLNRTR